MSNVLTFERHSDENAVSDALEKLEQSRYNLQSLQNLADPEWLINGFLMRDSIAVLWSDPKVGKSFQLIDWAMSIASGINWRGHHTVQGKVMILAGEGVRGLRKRVNAWMQYREVFPEDDDFQVFGMMPDLLNDAYFEATKSLVEQDEPVLIAIDTYARAMTGHEENSNREAGLMIERIEELRQVCGSCVLVVHHSNSAATGLQKMRGATALRGALDTEIEMRLTESENKFSPRELWCRSQKDAEPFDPVPVHFHSMFGSIVPLASPSWEQNTNSETDLYV